MENKYLRSLVELPENYDVIVSKIDESKLKPQMGKSLVNFRLEIIKIKKEISNLNELITNITSNFEGENSHYSDNDKARWLNQKTLLISKVGLLTLKMQEKAAFTELITTKYKLFNGEINGVEYSSLRDDILLSILICRANIYKTKEQIKNFCFMNDIKIDIKWFEQFGVVMYENKRDLSRDQTYSKLLEARDIYKAIVAMKKEQALPQHENEKEFIALKMMVTEYICELVYQITNASTISEGHCL